MGRIIAITGSLVGFCSKIVHTRFRIPAGRGLVTHTPNNRTRLME